MGRENDNQQVSRFISNGTSTHATLVKTGRGNVYGWDCYNNGTVIGYLKLYDSTTAPVVGTTAVLHTILIPANSSSMGAGCQKNSDGIGFLSGLGYGITTSIQDSGTALVAANQFSVNVEYK